MVTPEDIAADLGLPADSITDLERAQWQGWIEEALLLIEARPLVLADLDPRLVDYVVKRAVVAHVRNPSGATQVDVTVQDEGSVAERSAPSAGAVTIRDEWWRLLDPAGSTKRQTAYAVDTVPTGRGSLTGHADICSLNLGSVICSCGAYLTRNEYPLWEGGLLS